MTRRRRHALAACGSDPRARRCGGRGVDALRSLHADCRAERRDADRARCASRQAEPGDSRQRRGVGRRPRQRGGAGVRRPRVSGRGCVARKAPGDACRGRKPEGEVPERQGQQGLMGLGRARATRCIPRPSSGTPSATCRPSTRRVGGRPRSPSGRPVSPGNCRLWLGVAGGGVWRTKNALSGNPSWEFLSGSFGIQAIGSIVVDPNDPSGNTLYAGTGEANSSGRLRRGRRPLQVDERRRHVDRPDRGFGLQRPRDRRDRDRSRAARTRSTWARPAPCAVSRRSRRAASR